ncbi:MAG: serine hydrolase [Chlorobi bacterium]|nr:serine hydrolase [Chlorobiota bacterium]
MLHIKQTVNKKIYTIVILVVLIITLSAVYVINAKKILNKDIKTAIFENVNPAYADTTLKYLSVDEKIGQMIISDFGIIDSSSVNPMTKILYQTMPGGIIYNSDSVSQFIKYQNVIQKYSKVNPFVFLNTKSVGFDFSDVDKFPTFNILTTIKSDTVKRNYIKTVLKLFRELNITSVIIKNNPENKDSDCELNRELRNQIFNSEKILLFENAELFLNSDSIKQTINKKIISDGLTGIFCDETGNSNTLKKIQDQYGFKGLFLKKIKKEDINRDTLLAYLNSGANIFITDSPKILKSNLLKLIDNKDLTENYLRASVRKILLAKTMTGLNKTKHIYKTVVDSLIKSPQIIISKLSVYKNSLSLIKNKNSVIPYKNLKYSKFTLLVAGKNNLPELKRTFNVYNPVKYSFIDVSKDNFINKIRNCKKNTNFIVAVNNIIIDSVFIKAVFENNNAKSSILVNLGKPENLIYADSFSSVLQVYGNSKPEQHFAADALFGGIALKGKLACEYRNFAQADSISETAKVRVSNCLPEEVGLNSEILNKIDSVAKNAVLKGAFPGCQVVVLKNGYNIYDKSFGYHTYTKRQRVKKTDLYDLASVTKIAATTTAAMKLYSQGRIRLNDKLKRFFRDTEIDYSNIKPDTIINIDTLKYSEIKNFKKILKFQDTLHINDSILIAFDTLIVTLTPKNNIFNVKIRDLLLHKSGITPTLPILPYVIFKKNFYDSLEIKKQRFYENLKNDTTVKNKNIEFNPRYEIQKIYDKYFTKYYIKDTAEIKIADGFYFKNNWFDTLWRDTKRLKVYSRKIYQYSDINMILLQSAIDTLNHRSMNSYMRNTFYLPMGLRTMCYKPRKYFPLNRIVPTENDKYWREQLLRGSVHDPSAAMLGGISGNAGLFSDAYDLSVLGQMWLNGGTYGGIRYISENTIKKFTGFQEDSYRGLGFDKPHKNAIIAKDAPPESFGHTGFTGTCIWVDPVNKIVLVFLSNRVNPSAKNWRINSLKIRQKIHQIVYDAMKVKS